MAIPQTGSVEMSGLNTELGYSSSAVITLNDTNVRRLGAKDSGVIAMSDFRGAIAILSNTTNVNLFTLAGSPSTSGSYRFVVFPGVTIGATSGNTAMTVGQFPSGSTIQVDNYGSIQGYGGAAGTSGVGGAGGDAINANYANQTVVINNKAGATVYGGGGGGGKGGTGGTGGQGSYTSVQTLGVAGYSIVDCNAACVYYYGSGAYCGSGCDNTYGTTQGCASCKRNVTNYSSGGAGGAGGDGAVGQGYSQAAGTGSNGSAGSAGGTNAGTGGTGGKGGNGGAWGTAGSTGNTGSTGASGNYTAGAGGAAGFAGGAAGRYLVKGSNSVTFNNSGTVAGGLA